MSGFRLICIAALTALAPAAAAAQTATAADQPGKAYLAGLRPPHSQHKPAHLKTIGKTSQLAERTPAAKTTPLATQRQPAVASKTKVHRPAWLTQKSLAEKSVEADLRLRDAIETIPEAFVLWDASNRLVLCN